MRRALTFLFCLMVPVWLMARAEKEKPDVSPAAKLKRDIEYIASSKTEGRLTGSKGESMVADYLENRFKSIGIGPYKNKYRWEFTTKTGIKVGEGAYFKLFEQNLKIGQEVIVLPYSNGNSLRGFTMPKVYEQDNVWMISLREIKAEESNNVQKLLYEQARLAFTQGAASVVFYNDIDVFQDLSQVNLQNFETLSRPVVLLNHKAYDTYLKDSLKKDWIIVDARLGFEDANANGKNVVAMIDNKALFTIVVGAHYDHLGNFGESYLGADDNASGVAALLLLAEMTRQAGLKNFNYLFIAFSGKEQGLQGSKAFLQQNEALLPGLAAMIDLDMLGRLNATRDLYISGVGTSPAWAPMVNMMNKGFKLNIDSSGYGYSDYTTFYNHNIPVLRFSSGYHEDYMKPSDEPSKINYLGVYDVTNYIFRVLGETDRRTKPIFNKTNDILAKLEKQKGDLGIIPDFSFNENGIRIAACIPNKTASKSGMLSGDVIGKIGPFTIIDFDDYMEAMRKSEAGREITVIVKRGKNDYKFFIVL